MIDSASFYHLQVPTPPPEPKPGCTLCASLDEQRRKARAEGDYSQVSDCNIRLRNHQHISA
jgi:hypothetical protein